MGKEESLTKTLDDMSRLLIMARMASRDGEYERLKDSMHALTKASTAVYLAASQLHNEASR